MNYCATRVPFSLSKGERVALCFAVAAGVFFIARKLMVDVLLFDALGYYMLGARMVSEGTWGYHDFLRTYGCPLFLSWFFNLTNILPLRPWFDEGRDMTAWPVIITGQFLLYLAASYALRGEIAAFSLPVARLVFIGLCVNIYILSLVVEVLSEAPSLILYLLMIGLWLQMLQRITLPQLSQGWPRLKWLGGMCALLGFLVGFSAMIRPANYTFVVPLLAAWLTLVFSIYRQPALPKKHKGAVVMLLGMALGFSAAVVPQWLINRIYYDTLSLSSAENNLWWAQVPGVLYMKYQTTYQNATLIALNPFFGQTFLDHSSPLRWYVDYPFRALGFLFLKLFNMLDHDYFFTYIWKIRPWWRLPLSVFNHAGIGLAVLGFWVWFRQSWKRVVHFDGLALWMLLIFVGSSMALNLTTAADMRYGIIMIQAAFPLAVYGINYSRQQSPAVHRKHYVGVSVYCVLALILSEWVRYHTPFIGSNLAPFFDMAGAMTEVITERVQALFQ